MQQLSLFQFMRRILLPHSGEELLTRTQSLRLIVTWIVFFSWPMLLCTLTFILAVGSVTLERALLLLLIVLLSGVVFFGGLAWLVVSMSNRGALILQRNREKQVDSTSGGR